MRQLDYAAIRKRIPIHRVLALLHWEPASCRGQQWRGPCPLPCSSMSGSQTESFSIHVARDLYRCFHCGHSGNQLDLWVAITGQPLYPATLDLCRRLAITPITLKNPQPRTVD